MADNEKLDPQPPARGGGRATALPVAADPGIADPAGLGLGAFAMTTFVLSCFNAGLINESVEAVVVPLALFYGGLAQLLAGMWEFRRGNTFAATAFASFGAFWLSFAMYITQIAPHLDPAHAYQATGVYLLAWTIFTAYMSVAAMRTTGAVLGVFVVLTLTFLFLTIGAFAQSTAMDKVGGWAGLVTAVIAWYASFASVANSTWKRDLVPTWPLG
ncbi:acetate uptake transporter [Streptomyces sp. NPDC051320]|uniref:acetate uptake transporter n=1 Tax=Streptomyces sp. NPDC051320 TaxID=3154644 RepID=UPI003427A5A0